MTYVTMDQTTALMYILTAIVGGLLIGFLVVIGVSTWVHWSICRSTKRFNLKKFRKQ